MAINWKKRHEMLQAAAEALRFDRDELELERDQLRARNNRLVKDLSLACVHMLAAADQLAVREALPTAHLLRREAERLNTGGMTATPAKGRD